MNIGNARKQYMIKYQVNDTDPGVMMHFGLLINDQDVIALLFFFIMMFLKEIYIYTNRTVASGKLKVLFYY